MPPSIQQDAALTDQPTAPYLRSMNKNQNIALGVSLLGLACVLLVAVLVVGHTMAMPPV